MADNGVRIDIQDDELLRVEFGGMVVPNRAMLHCNEGKPKGLSASQCRQLGRALIFAADCLDSIAGK